MKSPITDLTIWVIFLPVAFAQTGPTVDLPILGQILGKEIKTKGNLGNEPKTYFSYRNIPYANSVSTIQRFSQPTLRETRLDPQPYDATKTGPVCQQGSIDAEFYNQLLSLPIDDIVNNTLQGLGAIGGLIKPDFAVRLLESLLKTEISGKTGFQFLQDLLDINLQFDEDCLHLAVYTPRIPSNPDNSSELLPVMFFIHGGGFSSGTQIKMGPERLGDVADVVLVTINYRVGYLGFLCLDDEEAAGNMGMLDMVIALKWVQKFIKHFGGNPGSVTIFGESAGSAAIGHLLVSHHSENLFHRAIGQSGSAVSPWAFDMEPEVHGRGVAEKVGCNMENTSEMIKCLKALPASTITSAFSEYSAEGRLNGTLGFGGTIPCAQSKGSDKFYTEGQHPEEILLTGDYEKLPIFFGANQHEGSYVYGVAHNTYLKPNNKTNDAEFLTYDLVELMFRMVDVNQGFAFSDEITKKYFDPEQLGSLEAMTPGIIDALGVFFIKASGYKMVEDNALHGATSFWYSIEHQSRKSAYHLLFPIEKPPNVNPGVCHADELMYLFDVNLPFLLCDLTEFAFVYLMDLPICGTNATCYGDTNSNIMTKFGECLDGHLTPEEEAWSDRIVKAWTNFAIYGTPTPDVQGADWPKLSPWSRKNPDYLVFGPEGLSIHTDYKLTYSSKTETVTSTSSTESSSSTQSSTSTTTTTTSATSNANCLSVHLPAFLTAMSIFWL